MRLINSTDSNFTNIKLNDVLFKGKVSVTPEERQFLLGLGMGF